MALEWYGVKKPVPQSLLSVAVGAGTAGPVRSEPKPALAGNSLPKQDLAQNKLGRSQNKPGLSQNTQGLSQNKPALTQNKAKPAQNKSVPTQNKPDLAQNKAGLVQSKPVLAENKAGLAGTSNGSRKQKISTGIETIKPHQDEITIQITSPNSSDEKVEHPKSLITEERLPPPPKDLLTPLMTPAVTRRADGFKQIKISPEITISEVEEDEVGEFSPTADPLSYLLEFSEDFPDFQVRWIVLVS